MSDADGESARAETLCAERQRLSNPNERTGGRPGAEKRLIAGETLSLRQRWWAQQDSNLRPADYESAALTN